MKYCYPDKGNISLKNVSGMVSKVQLEGLDDDIIDIHLVRVTGMNLFMNLIGLNVVPISHIGLKVGTT